MSTDSSALRVIGLLDRFFVQISSGAAAAVVDPIQTFTGCAPFQAEGAHVALSLSAGISLKEIVSRKQYAEQTLRVAVGTLSAGKTASLEVTPADAGWAALLAKKVGPQAKVLLATVASPSLEPAVALLLNEDLLGGLRLGDFSDPYQLFRVFQQILAYLSAGKKETMISYHLTVGGEAELGAAIQAVSFAQELYLKAALVDPEEIGAASPFTREEILRTAFFTDISPLLHAWRKKRSLAIDPLDAYRRSRAKAAAPGPR